MADLLLPDHPADAVDDIAFAASIGADDPGNSFIKQDMCLICKTLKTLDF